MKHLTTYKARTIPPPEVPKKRGYRKGVLWRPNLAEMQEASRERHKDNPRHFLAPDNTGKKYRTRGINPDPPKPQIFREQTLSEWEKLMLKYAG